MKKISEIKLQKRNNKRLIVAAIALMIVAISTFSYGVLDAKNKALKEVPISQLDMDVSNGNVKSIHVIPDFLFQYSEVELTSGEQYKVAGPHLNTKEEKVLSDSGISVKWLRPTTDWRNLPAYLSVGLMILLFAGMFGQHLGFSLMRASTRSKIKFSDVAGNDEAKTAMTEVVDYLKHPSRYEAIGASFPKGILLGGSPGTGKTLLAKAIAGEAGANFLAINGSDFSSMFVSMSSMKLRGIFSRAKRMAPCIIFIDEIDAIGGKRLSEGSSVAREMSSTLNSLLVQMDGFESNSGVIVIAATNRIELLDPALLRSGRFDRHIHMQLPTLSEREEIMKLHAQKIKIGDFDFTTVCKACIGMSGADLSNIINQAALIAVSEGSLNVHTSHGLKARDRLIMGDARMSQALTMTTRNKTLLAIHEAGHALVAIVHGPEKVSRVSIIPRGQSLGQTMLNPVEDKLVHDREDIIGSIRLLLGGRAAEIVAGKTETSGACDDLLRASKLAMDMVGKYGMGNSSLLQIGTDASETFKRKQEVEASEILANCLKSAKDTIVNHKDIFNLMVTKLLEKEEIEEVEIGYFTSEIIKKSLSYTNEMLMKF